MAATDSSEGMGPTEAEVTGQDKVNRILSSEELDLLKIPTEILERGPLHPTLGEIAIPEEFIVLEKQQELGDEEAIRIKLKEFVVKEFQNYPDETIAAIVPQALTDFANRVNEKHQEVYKKQKDPAVTAPVFDYRTGIADVYGLTTDEIRLYLRKSANSPEVKKVFRERSLLIDRLLQQAKKAEK